MVSIDFVYITKMNKLLATGPGFMEFIVEISYNISKTCSVYVPALGS